MTRLAATLALALAARAGADTVYLRNGNEMKGKVVSRDKSGLVLDIGYGTVTLSADQVLRVALGRDPGLREAGFASGRRVPKGGEALDAAYREAQKRREKALDARDKDRLLSEEAADIRRRLPDEKEALRQAAQNLAQLSPSVDARAYNDAVGASNAAAASIQADQLRLEQIDDARRAVAGQTRLYLRAWRAFAQALKAPPAGKLARSGAAGRSFVAWARARSREMGQDFKADSVDSSTRGDRVIVAVTINGKPAGRFLVDTGASMTVIYAARAAKLELAAAAVVGKTNARVADGRLVPADVVRLDSIQVGNSRVDGALAVVVNAEEPDFDGLLGMSFLGNFATSVDPAAGRLTLESLK